MENKNNPNLNLETFVSLLIEEKGFENVDPEIEEQLKADLLKRVEDRINVAIINNLPKEKMTEFNELLDNANQDEIQDYCNKNISGLDEIIAQELMSFRATYLNL
ncbi:MAG: DUF5663 domain-containing protein [Candidatus Moraniibacteriota bacterium]